MKRYLAEGIRVGLGSDMAGSNTLSLLRAITDAIHVSKARWALRNAGRSSCEEECSVSGGGILSCNPRGEGLWERVGSFEEGYCFDAVVMDDSRISDYCERSSYERTERLILMSDDKGY